MQRVSAVHSMTLSFLVAALACHRPAQTHTDVDPAPLVSASASADGQSCRVKVPGLDVSSWEEIAANGFTFCVPSDGRQMGDTWRSGTTRLAWGTRPSGPSDRTVFEKSDVSTLPRGQNVSRQFREDIGGRKARILVGHDDRFFTAWAQWNSPAVWLTAESSEVANAETIQLAIFRTVRFSNAK